MTNSHAKGKRAELELARYLTDLTGWPVARRLTEGRRHDQGDLSGLPECVAQVRDWIDPAEAERTALSVLEEQRQNAGVPFAVAFIRHRGGRWVAAMTPGQFATLLHAATEPANDHAAT